MTTERKIKIFTIIPIIILSIQLLFHMDYIWTISARLFYDFDIVLLRNVFAYLVDIVAIVALFKRSKMLLCIYWVLSATGAAEVLVCIFVASSVLVLNQKAEQLIKKIYYMPIIIYVIDTFAYIISSGSPVSSMIRESLLVIAYYCMVYWCVKIPEEK